MSTHQLQIPPSPESLASRKRSRSPIVAPDDRGGSAQRPKLAHSDNNSHDAPWAVSVYPQRPSLAVFDSRFSQAVSRAHQAIDHFLAQYGQMQAMGLVNAELESIADDLNELREFQRRYPELLPTILLGASNAGKSSATNSCLGDSGAAAVSSTDRGTHKVIRYRQALTTQLSKFLVMVHYFSRAELEDIVTSKVKVIFDYLETSSQSGEDGDGYDSEDDVETYQLLKHDDHQRFATAIEFFHEPLRELADFKSADSTTAYFQSCLTGSRDETASRMVDMLEGVKAKCDISSDNIESYPAKDLEQLADVFRRVCCPTVALQGEVQPAHPAALVRTVCVHLDNDLLAAGVVIADSPGVTDSNTDVVDAAFNALRESGTVLVFADFQRAKDNPEINRQLTQCILAGRMHDTHLVLSKVDRPDVPNEFERAGHDVGLVASLESAERLLCQLQAESQSLYEQQMDADLDDKVQEHFRLSRQLHEVNARVADAQGEVRSISTKMHVHKARIDMQGRFHDLTRSSTAPDLPVHCISNSRFQTLLALKARSSRNSKFHDRDLVSTGIPELRAIMYRTVAVGRLNVLAAVLKNDLPSTFESVMGLVNKSFVSNKEGAAHRLNDVYKGSDKMLARQTRSLKRLFSEAMTTVLNDNRQNWSERAVRELGPTKKSKGWRAYRVNTFRAFCTYNGRFKAPSNPQVTSWNEALRDIMHSGVTAEFQKLEDIVEYVAGLSEFRFRQAFDCLKQDLQGILGTTDQARNFYAWLDSERDRVVQLRTTYGLRRDSSAAATNFRPPPTSLIAKLRNIGYKITLHAECDGYVLQAMRATYKECDEIDRPDFRIVMPSGGRRRKTRIQRIGAHEQRVDLIRSVFEGTNGRTSVFEVVGNLATESWQAPVDAWARNMKAVLSTSVKRIKREFERRFNGTDQQQQQPSLSAAAVQTLKSACAKAMEDVHAGKRLVEELQGMEKEHAAAWEDIGVKG